MDVTRQLGLPKSTLNSIIAKKRVFMGQAVKCGTSAKNRKTSKELAYSRMEKYPLCMVSAGSSIGIPVDGTILWEKSIEIAAAMKVENFSASNGWLCCFKQCHGLIFKKFARESSTVDTNIMVFRFERLPELLEGYEAYL